MLSVDDAIAAMLDRVVPLPEEAVPLDEIVGRTAARDVFAKLTQPPFPASAMDGYAARIADARPGARLNVIGAAPAGAPFGGAVGPGEAVRIFTGGVLPDGADHIIIQEDAARDGETIIVKEPQPAPRHIRAAGLDFREGDRLIAAGERLHEIHGSVAAAANIDSLPAVRRPRVAIFSNGDELIEPGGSPGDGQIIDSTHYAIAALVHRWGGVARYLGRAGDSVESVASLFEAGADADIAVPVGGASVGDLDCVRPAFLSLGGEILVEKTAMRPGKPTWCGRRGAARILGLPGNPASSIVAAAIFLRPLIARLSGRYADPIFDTAFLAEPIEANGEREQFLRATTETRLSGAPLVRAWPNQDSALVSPFAACDALIRRRQGAPSARAGDEVEIISVR